MSGAAGAAAMLCCCGDSPSCGDCRLSYRINWSGSLELLALCCPHIECPDPNPEAGEFTTSCGPCEFIIKGGGNSCRGDCPGLGCTLLVYDGEVGPLEAIVTADGNVPPCIYRGIMNGSLEVNYCCPPDPDRPYCGSGQWGRIDYLATFSLTRGGFGLPDKDWVAIVSFVLTMLPNQCEPSGPYVLTFHAKNSGDLCPEDAVFEVVKDRSSWTDASMVDPCNLVSDYCPKINVHSAFSGGITVRPV